MIAATNCAQACVGVTSFGAVLQVAGQLFGVTVEAADGKAPVWNSDVRFFCIKQDGKPRAYFFFVSIHLAPRHYMLSSHAFRTLQLCIKRITNNGLVHVDQKRSLGFCFVTGCGHLHG